MAVVTGEGQSLLGRLIGADMNSTADQAILMNSARYVIRRIVVTNVSTSLTLAAGGFYTGAGKTGNILVAAGQLYSALTAAALFLDAVVAANPLANVQTATTIFFSLTTAQGGAATADIFIYGDNLD